MFIRFSKSTLSSKWNPKQSTLYVINLNCILCSVGPTWKCRKWAHQTWGHPKMPGLATWHLTEEWRLPQERVHRIVSSMRGRCTTLAVKVAQQDNVFTARKTVMKGIYMYWLYKKEWLFICFINKHFCFKCNESCKHLLCFISLFFAISLNFNCLTFLFIFVQFCNFTFVPWDR